MFDELANLLPFVAPFVMVLFRIVGLFAFVPFFSNVAIPTNIKVLLALAISFCVYNVVPKPDIIPQQWGSLIGITWSIVGEMSVGLLIGTLVSLVFMGITLGTHQLSTQMGLSMATIFDPTFNEQSTVIEQFGYWLALLVFFTLGGHREVINAIVYSYQTVPMGQAMDPNVMLATVIGGMDAAFHAALRIATPALVAFILATLAGGILSRSMPQMNLMTLGINMNLLIGFAMIVVGLSGWALVAQQSFQGVFGVFHKLFGY